MRRFKSTPRREAAGIGKCTVVIPAEHCVESLECHRLMNSVEENNVSLRIPVRTHETTKEAEGNEVCLNFLERNDHRLFEREKRNSDGLSRNSN